ncbi:MAG TPA: hypothetical protein VN176_15965, partial [Verrucomicrobiae bacterium]|nr:hypothetical protein [Verrucomicrobiae bacterium]
ISTLIFISAPIPSKEILPGVLRLSKVDYPPGVGSCIGDIRHLSRDSLRQSPILDYLIDNKESAWAKGDGNLTLAMGAYQGAGFQPKDLPQRAQWRQRLIKPCFVPALRASRPLR